MRAPATDLPISFRDVSLHVREQPIVTALDLDIGPGAPTVLIGPNGCGKSTLIRLAFGLATADSGRITWGGCAGTDGRRLALMAQRPVMLRRSAAGNVAYALAAAGMPRPARATRTAALLDQAGLTALAARPARRMSGGEQQRLALARALARDPEVLFLDEPTASLDPAATKQVEDLIAAVAASGVKVVMATHDLGQARRLAGDIVFMAHGRVREHAAAQRFFTVPTTPEARAFLAGDLVL